MKIFSKIIFAASLMATAMATPATAQDAAVELKGDVKAVKTMTDDSGNTSTELVAPEVIVPGDRLMFITSYRNTSAEPAENFVVTNPLPSAVRLAPDADAGLTVSVDGGATWGKLSALTVTDEDGAARAADHADVTHIRWMLASVAPGAAGDLQYPAIIR
ncbi:hypothetical protein [Qipengyuania sp. DGS5-3]|uniref:hypothetical protein n=1 Tax=Qipengyuania sp. DGS5-3 TaxID=3349632 RepID=UPI0036D2DFB3